MIRLLTLLLLLNSFISYAWATDYTVDSACVGAWLFTEGSGTTVDNAQGNSAYDGNFKSSTEPTWDTTDIPFHTTGSAPNSVTFAGDNDYIDCNDVDASTSFSLVSWGYKHTTGIQTIIGKCDSSTSRANYYFRINGGSGYRGSQYREITVPDVALNAWHHHALTWDGYGGYLIYWLDGVNTVQSGTIYNDDPALSNDDCRLGELGEFNGQYWDGGLTEVAVFSDTLTSTEINEIYDYGLKPSTGTIRRRIVIVS